MQKHGAIHNRVVDGVIRCWFAAVSSTVRSSTISSSSSRCRRSSSSACFLSVMFRASPNTKVLLSISTGAVRISTKTCVPSFRLSVNSSGPVGWPKLFFPPTGAPPWGAEAEVVYAISESDAKPEGYPAGVGLAFVSPSAEQVERLRRYVARFQEIARQLTASR